MNFSVGKPAGANCGESIGSIIVGDNELRTTDSTQFIIAPIPSITENYKQACDFLKIYGKLHYKLAGKYMRRHTTIMERKIARKALLDINMKCYDLVFNSSSSINGQVDPELLAMNNASSEITESKTQSDDYDQAVRFIKHYGVFVGRTPITDVNAHHSLAVSFDVCFELIEAVADNMAGAATAIT